MVKKNYKVVCNTCGNEIFMNDKMLRIVPYLDGRMTYFVCKYCNRKYVVKIETKKVQELEKTLSNLKRQYLNVQTSADSQRLSFLITSAKKQLGTEQDRLIKEYYENY